MFPSYAIAATAIFPQVYSRPDTVQGIQFNTFIFASISANGWVTSTARRNSSALAGWTCRRKKGVSSSGFAIWCGVKAVPSFCRKPMAVSIPTFCASCQATSHLLSSTRVADRWTDAEDDRVIGGLWAGLSAGRCRFVMLKDRQWDSIEMNLGQETPDA